MKLTVEKIEFFASSGRSVITAYNPVSQRIVEIVKYASNKIVVMDDLGKESKGRLDVPFDPAQLEEGSEIEVSVWADGRARITHSSNQNLIEDLKAREDQSFGEWQNALEAQIAAYQDSPYYREAVEKYEESGNPADLPPLNHLDYPKLEPRKHRQFRAQVFANESFKDEYGNLQGWLLLADEHNIKKILGWVDLTEFPELLNACYEQSTNKLACGQPIEFTYETRDDLILRKGQRVLLDGVPLRRKVQEFV